MSIMTENNKNRSEKPRFFLAKMQLFLNNLRVNSILFDALNAVLAAGFRLIALARRDNLTVLCFEAETELALLVLVNLELRVLFGREALNRLVLDSRHGCVCDNAVYAVFARLERIIRFARRDNFAVSRLEIEHKPIVLGLFDFKLAHIFPSFQDFGSP